MRKSKKKNHNTLAMAGGAGVAFLIVILVLSLYGGELDGTWVKRDGNYDSPRETKARVGHFPAYTFSGNTYSYSQADECKDLSVERTNLDEDSIRFLREEYEQKKTGVLRDPDCHVLEEGPGYFVYCKTTRGKYSVLRDKIELCSHHNDFVVLSFFRTNKSITIGGETFIRK